MAKNIEPKPQKIGDYLKLERNTIFTVPDYQRAYSWSIENCDKLWQDISDFSESNSEDKYFFGTIIINCRNDDSIYELIDGQQRTTTFLLLLKALLLRINRAIVNSSTDRDSSQLLENLQDRRKRITSILYRIDTDEVTKMPDVKQDGELYSRVNILNNCSINEKTEHKNDLKTILQATDFRSAEERVFKIKYKQRDNRFTNYFKNFKFFYNVCSTLGESKLNTIAKTVTEKCEVIEIKSWQVEQAITMFNSLNSAGLPLYDSDIISAQLYAEARRKGQEELFKSQWKRLKETIDELEGLQIATINSILMQYMYFLRTKNKETVNDSGAPNVTTPGLRRYFTEIQNGKNAVADPDQMCSDLFRLAMIWKKVSEYAQIKVLLKFNDNAKLFLASFFFRFSEEEISEETLTPILDCMLRLFALLELGDAGYSSKNFKSFLFGEELRFIDNSVPLNDIVNDFNEHIRRDWNKEDIQSKLQDEYDGNVLVVLNEFLFAREHNVPFSLGEKYDIEHIMPSSGSNLQLIRQDAGITDEEQFSEIVNKLGNKILLEDKINRSIGNEWFRTKVSTKLENKPGYINSKYPLARALVNQYQTIDKPLWRIDDIKTATKKASDRIVRFIFGDQS